MKEDWDKPSLQNLHFVSIREGSARWVGGKAVLDGLEREFQIGEVRHAVFNLGGDKAPVPNGFPIVFFQRFWDVLKDDIMAFMRDFHARGKLSKIMFS